MDDPQLPFQAHSDTSRESAIQAEPTAQTQRQRVLQTIRDYGPMTDEAIQMRLDMNPSTERPRRVELVNNFQVRDSGRRGKTSSGRKAVLWESY